jgi:6-phosphogluconolactonase
VSPDVRVQADADGVAAAAALAIADAARNAIATRGRFALALSGGDTPRATYRVLARRTEIDWPAWELFFGDERSVPPDDPASNFRAVRDTLLATPAANAARVHRMPADAADPEAAAREYEALLRRRLGDPPRFDVVLLGLGHDGHVASLFPQHAALAERERFVVATPAPTYGPRLTLTFAALAAARAVFFLVTGAGKAAILSRVLRPPPDPMTLPAQGIAPDDGRVIWFVDRAAAPA